MANIDKVIKGLECCQYSSKAHCDGCPYAYDGLCSTNACTADLARDALVLLKEQEPVAPYVGAEGITINCGNCGETVGYYPAGSSVPDKKCVYCPECGREIKWDG